MVRLALVGACLATLTNADTCPADPEVYLCDYTTTKEATEDTKIAPGVEEDTTTTKETESAKEASLAARSTGGSILALGVMLANGHGIGSSLLSSFAVASEAASSSEMSTGHSELTCGAMKEMYKAQECCGAPDKETHLQVVPSPATQLQGTNICAGKKPDWPNTDCFAGDVTDQMEQAGGDVTDGFVGGLDVGGREPIREPYWKKGLCPVNVHWHIGAEHRSRGQFDEDGKGPHKAGTPASNDPTRRLSGDAQERYGYACHLYDMDDAKFTTDYDWKHCLDMHVGETYEVHWPHSALGDCHTPNQYQSPFYDGVFCHYKPDTDHANLTLQQIADSIGVQSQVFTIVNDEEYYYPNLIRGMIVDGDYGKDIAAYTGSSTGTTRNNKVCSKYAPITWQVDRKCQLISASTFDKMCADMKQMRDDMSSDLHAHGARELVWKNLTANNMNEPSGEQ